MGAGADLACSSSGPQVWTRLRSIRSPFERPPLRLAQPAPSVAAPTRLAEQNYVLSTGWLMAYDVAGHDLPAEGITLGDSLS